MFVFIIRLNFRKNICIIYYLIKVYVLRVRPLKDVSCASTGIYEDCSAAW